MLKMKNKTAITLAFLILTVLSLQSVDLTYANPGPATRIAPVVNVSDIEVKTSFRH